MNPILDAVFAARTMAEDYSEDGGSLIGRDGYMGPPWAAILEGARSLLSGTGAGDLDCAQVDRFIFGIARAGGWDLDRSEPIPHGEVCAELGCDCQEVSE